MNTLFDKIWDAHVVQKVEDGPTQLYIDRLYCHEVTSPQAFAGLRARGIKCFRPEKIFCMPDHNTPTHDQDKPIEDPVSKTQVDTLAKNAEDFGLEHFGMMDKKNGIIHVVGPDRGLTLPGMTIVCGDSHTSTHGAMGAVAFGIGTSEVEMVMASQCILQTRPKTMRITVDGKLGKGVTAKDVALYMMSKMTTSGATGYFVEYAGELLAQAQTQQVFTGGASQILKFPEYRDADKAHELMSFISDSKEDLPMPTGGASMQILIGPENVSDALKDSSVVIASYDIGENMRGLVGVVGPTRMDYATVAARLSYFAESLSRMFGKPQELPPGEERKT